jgi:ribose-phosphate pyrophosphokinase
LVADLIVEAGFNRVLTMDLHADQIQGFFPREVPLDHLNAGQLFADYFNGLAPENAVVLAADAGNIKKAEKYRRGFKFPTGLSVVDKERDAESGQVIARRISGDSVEGKVVLMLDDIISTAGTTRGAIDLGLEYGAKGFYVAGTHGELVGPAIERLNHPAIKEIAITDTVPALSRMRNELPLRILSVTDLFAEAILRIHRFESISELLGIYG